MRGLGGRLAALAAAAVLTAALLLLAAPVRSIPSASMRPTLWEGDLVWVNLTAYRLTAPGHGDLAVLWRPEGGDRVEYIKRIVGLPGDEVRLVSGQVFLNGVPLQEPWLAPSPEWRVPVSRPDLPQARADEFGPVVVPAGHVFVLGDNRGHSADSRSWAAESPDQAFIPFSQLRGAAFAVVWPAEHWRLLL